MSDALQARIGRFNTPFGFWIPVHWTILMDTIRPPMYASMQLIPEQQQGCELSGSLSPRGLFGGEGELRYTAYTGYPDQREVLDASGSQGWSAGGDLRFSLWEGSVGFSYYQQRRKLEGGDQGERSVIAYGETDLPANLVLRAEYVRQFRDDDVRPSDRHLGVGYASLRWNLSERAYLSYRFDGGDDDTDPQSSKRLAQTLTLGLLPRPWIRIKLELSDQDFRGGDREDFLYWGLSVGSVLLGCGRSARSLPGLAGS